MPNQESKKSYEFFAPKVFIRTFGCQMNVRDTELVSGLLKGAGYKLVKEPEKADVIIFNTCSVRQHAEDRVWSGIGRFRKPKTANRKPIIGVIGCMAQNYKEGIFQRAPGVDFIVGPQDLHKIPEILSGLSENQFLYERKIWETDGQGRPEEIYSTGFHQDKEHAYVVISEGCSNFCSYCVVPYVRGELRHRNYEDILKEIEEALDKGITKVTLLGQNVNAYQSSLSFMQLLEKVNKIKGLKEFSFLTSHPRDTSVQLFKVMAGCEKLKKCLHLPVQSGSDKILAAMNRGYTRKFYLDLADSYRKIIKGAALTTDIIVGFPTEGKKDFQDTCDLLKNAKFNAAYIFKYSPRPHTEAVKFTDDVAREEKERRHRLILELQRKISRNKKINP